MKLRIVLDVDVSPTLAETIQRGGLVLCQDGSGYQVKVGPDSPVIPKRKTKVQFIENPQTALKDLPE